MTAGSHVTVFPGSISLMYSRLFSSKDFWIGSTVLQNPPKALLKSICTRLRRLVIQIKKIIHPQFTFKILVFHEKLMICRAFQRMYRPLDIIGTTKLDVNKYHHSSVSFLNIEKANGFLKTRKKSFLPYKNQFSKKRSLCGASAVLFLAEKIEKILYK